MLSPEDIDFIRAHSKDDSVKLLLSAQKYPNLNVRFLTSIIEGKKKISLKVPEWIERFDLCFPSILSVEQCSSSYTAKYKSRFFEGRDVVDITGGLGVDSYFISEVAKSIVYIEKNKELFECVNSNFNRLGVSNAEYINKEVKDRCDLEMLSKDKVYTIYADPSRRGPSDNRIFNPSDYEPDMQKLMKFLLEISDRIVIKISPMADISALINSFELVSEIVIVSVFNECKEILIKIDRAQEASPIHPGMVKLVAVNLDKQKKRWDNFEWTLMEERESKACITTPKKGFYLYEPNSSILKGGAFKLLSNRYPAGKISVNSHLYTSSDKITDFPGRTFVIEEIMKFDKKNIKTIHHRYPKANVSTRNFPLSPPELKDRLDIKDGGEIFLYGTLFNDDSKNILICKKGL
ncbi:MAG TPA: SAM-dependent methyltransferase [Rikenellaceae bacterium]|nr:SAM-dependent methyltransferase [Rikenellaceae bacterium]